MAKVRGRMRGSGEGKTLSLRLRTPRGSSSTSPRGSSPTPSPGGMHVPMEPDEVAATLKGLLGARRTRRSGIDLA